jgi:hypothetical protein
MYSPANGLIEFTPTAGSGNAFTGLQFGGTTSSFPCIAPSGTIIEFVTAASSCTGSFVNIEAATVVGETAVQAPLFQALTLYSAAGTALPTCNSGAQGERAVVSDAASPTYMGTYTSGANVTAEVICSYNGTTYSWLTH